MRGISFILCLLVGAPVSAGFLSHKTSNYKIGSKELTAARQGKIVFGYSLVPEKKLGKAIRALIPKNKSKEKVRIYHARSVFQTNRSVDQIAKRLMPMNKVQFFKKLQPKDKHTATKSKNCKGACIQTRVEFPAHWKGFVELGKSNLFGLVKKPILDSTKAGHLSFKTGLQVFNSRQLPKALASYILKQEEQVKKKTDLFILQDIFDVNQLAQFGTTAVSLYRAAGNKTLVAVDVILGIEEDVLQMGNKASVKKYAKIIRIDPETISDTIVATLTGNSVLNKGGGIGQGIPSYTKDMLVNLRKGL